MAGARRTPQRGRSPPTRRRRVRRTQRTSSFAKPWLHNTFPPYDLQPWFQYSCYGGPVSDSARLFAAQGARAFAYGVGAVVLGTTLEARGWSSAAAALFFAAALAGTVIANLVVGRNADRWGRRRTYVGLCALLSVAGIVLGSTASTWAMVAV